MQFTSIVALVALAMGASAQTSVPANVQQSVLLVLATALPTESASYALASQSAFASAIASSLSAGNTPAWYQALPSDVKSLLPIIYAANATPTPSGSGSVMASATSAMTSAFPSSVSSLAASSSQVSIASSTLSASNSKSTSSSATGAAATGGASLPTAAIGAGVGAALGFLGMLAL